MKPVDTHLSELERRIAQLEDIEISACKKMLAHTKRELSEPANYWMGYADCAHDFARALRISAGWRREHPL